MFMNKISHEQQLYAHECDCNDKMLTMLASVPEANRTDPRFQQALSLAAHLAACRENWLTWMAGEERPIVAWFERDTTRESLGPRFAALEERWTTYLGSLTDDDLEQTFSFTEANGVTYRVVRGGQITQLYGHAHYHRGQVVLLVDQLGGESVDTDFIDWIYSRDPRYGEA